MAISDDLGIFFNPTEFAVDAIIHNRLISGLQEQRGIAVNEVETQKTTFTCASLLILGIQHGEPLQLGDVWYTVVGIQPDGTGLTTLLLERR